MYKHRVQINAAKYTPMNDQMIVTGELRSVASTPFDFRVPKSLGVAIFQLPRKPVGILIYYFKFNSFIRQIHSALFF
jgi:hypothetical protein